MITVPSEKYDNLEGKEITFQGQVREIQGIITGIDFDLGISIQQVDHKDHYLMCLLGPSSPQMRDRYRNGELSEEEYADVFVLMINMLKRGFLSSQKITERYPPRREPPTEKDCVFAQ